MGTVMMGGMLLGLLLAMMVLQLSNALGKLGLPLPPKMVVALFLILALAFASVVVSPNDLLIVQFASHR